ncbi:carbonic anhydrase [Trichlorobacter lovleyi]|uniref:carbonic anhydrase n=1 Tax=Trichlorobacter lovleyi TaxID=313985 RepID=UPI00223ED5B5|nr:carbonic anhydrase [Trichlorobacter lovleyi]QOX79076.1 carbonic anhydrase [Trichlorobacter lovleyi]
MVKRIIAGIIGSALLAAGLVFASATHPAISADEALQKLVEGNKRYLDEKPTAAQRCTTASRAALTKSQSPYAIILTCSDSRVPPELLFDSGLGELFVIRVAGNIPDPVVLGSIEYAAEHLGTPLVMVLGHERCGAVTATVDAKGKAHGNIGAIVKTIAPSIKKATKDCAACKEDKQCEKTRKSEYVECVIDTNVKLVTANLTKNSKVLQHLVEQKKLKIVSAKYDLDDGKVTLFK